MTEVSASSLSETDAGLDPHLLRQDILNLVTDTAGFALTDDERASLLLVTFGDFGRMGAGAIDLANEHRYGGRLIIFLPGQGFPEHWHPSQGDFVGKEETFRVLWGSVHAFGERDFEGTPSPCRSWIGGDAIATHGVVLTAGQQRTIGLHERHWFLAGDSGAVALEMTSPVRDELDRFSDSGLAPQLL